MLNRRCLQLLFGISPAALAVAVVGCQVDLAAPGAARIQCTTRDDCPAGWRCDELTSRCLGPDTPAPRCGDGVVDPGEACDCGDKASEFPASCAGANSDLLPDRCRTDCTEHRCGDRAIDTDEQCDDGNNTSGDGCSPLCAAEICGNGVVDPGEVCDFGPGASGDGCSVDCLSDETCGNGYVDLIKDEQCDCGNSAETLAVGCLAVNGDPISQCTSGCLNRFCGNGVIDPGEVCDIGAGASGDGCSVDCLSDETCGNGYIDFVLGEECDCGNSAETLVAGCAAVNGDLASPCTANCKKRYCGNKTVDPGEVCDDGNFDPGDGCSAYCQSDETCRNGIVDFLAGELCDDGNALSHDGCSSDCRAESTAWQQVLTRTLLDGRARPAMAYDVRRRRVVLFGGVVGLIANDTWEYDGIRWLRVQTESAPAPRVGHKMVYDPDRGVTLLFGGGDAFGRPFADTWEYNGFDWREKTPAASPGARMGHAMAYDANRKRTVLFGGLVAGAWANDTWEYDGTTWSAVPVGPAPNPSVRTDTALAYHPGRQRIVMFGGETHGDPSFPSDRANDTWEFDGTDWVVPSPLTGAPGIRSRHSMVYVPAPIDRVVLFGGYADNNETWEYSGSAWNQVTSPATPAALQTRGWHGAAYDESRAKMVVFGGWHGNNPIGETWEYNNTSTNLRLWAQVSFTDTPPPPRFRHAVAYDTRRNRMVLFGGDDPVNALIDDTWEFDGANWFPILPSPKPAARRFHAMAYHAQKGVTVMFGGGGTNTCLYDNGNWTCATLSPTPTPRDGAAMAYDSKRQRVVLFGGQVATNVVSNETWEFDGTSWINRTPGPLPAIWPDGRWYHALAYDEAREVTVLYGGVYVSLTETRFLGDTWAWDGATWTPIADGDVLGLPPAAPAERESPIELGARIKMGMAYDSFHGRVVLGNGAPNYGVVGFQDQWALEPYYRANDSSPWHWRWQQVDVPGIQPSSRTYGLLFPDRRQARLVMYGGFAYDATTLQFLRTSELWALEATSDTPEEACANGIDDDGDGLVDCVGPDPDCVGRGFCASPCQDGTAEQTFSPGVAGCSGTVTFANRRSLCSGSARVCTAAEWFAYRNGTAPTYNYWTDDALQYLGGPGACAVTVTGGTPCAADVPFRVCASTTDPAGNTCNWTGCGFGLNTPNDYFGGCTGNTTAGTLCCTR